MKCVEKVSMPQYDCIQYTGNNIGEIVHWFINIGYNNININWYSKQYFHISFSNKISDMMLYSVKLGDFLVCKDSYIVSYDKENFNILYELSGL